MLLSPIIDLVWVPKIAIFKGFCTFAIAKWQSAGRESSTLLVNLIRYHSFVLTSKVAKHSTEHAGNPIKVGKQPFVHFFACCSPSRHPRRPILGPKKPTKALKVTHNAHMTVLLRVNVLVHNWYEARFDPRHHSSKARIYSDQEKNWQTEYQKTVAGGEADGLVRRKIDLEDDEYDPDDHFLSGLNRGW